MTTWKTWLATRGSFSLSTHPHLLLLANQMERWFGNHHASAIAAATSPHQGADRQNQQFIASLQLRTKADRSAGRLRRFQSGEAPKTLLRILSLYASITCNKAGTVSGSNLPCLAEQIAARRMGPRLDRAFGRLSHIWQTLTMTKNKKHLTW